MYLSAYVTLWRDSYAALPPEHERGASAGALHVNPWVSMTAPPPTSNQGTSIILAALLQSRSYTQTSPNDFTYIRLSPPTRQRD
jgi:hypothetical protein